MEGSKSVLIIAPSDRKFRVDIKSNNSQSDLELIKVSFEDICLKDFALKQIVDSSESHFIFKKFDPLFKCEVEITDKDVIEHGSVLHVTIISSVLANLNKLPTSSSTNFDNEILTKKEETILPTIDNEPSTSKTLSNTQPTNQNLQSIRSFIAGCLPMLPSSTVDSIMKIFVESGVQSVEDLKEIDPEKHLNGVLKVIHARKLRQAIQSTLKTSSDPVRNSCMGSIQEDMKQIKSNIAAVMSKQKKQPVVSQSTPAFLITSDLYLPLSTFSDIKRMEEFLSSSPNFDMLVNYLSSIGGNSLRSCTHAILQRLMRNCLAQNFSFYGTGEKERFSELKLCSAVIRAVKICYKESTENIVIAIMKNWLKLAPKRKLDTLDSSKEDYLKTSETIDYSEKMSSDSQRNQNEDVKKSHIISAISDLKISAYPNKSVGEIANSVKNENGTTFNGASKSSDFIRDEAKEMNQFADDYYEYLHDYADFYDHYYDDYYEELHNVTFDELW